MNNNLVKQLREAARKSGLTMNALALRSGLPYQTVHGFLTADRRITLESAAKLAAVLGLELRPVLTKPGGSKKGR